VKPDSFSFTLTLPGDARLMGVVRDLCAHAVAYAGVGDSLGGPFCARVTAAAERVVASGADGACALEFLCEGGELSVTIAGETIRQPLPA
jgi:hypothetical protein